MSKLDNETIILYQLIAKHGSDWVRKRILPAEAAEFALRDEEALVHLTFTGSHDDYPCAGVFTDPDDAVRYAQAVDGNVETRRLNYMPAQARAGDSLWSVSMRYDFGEDVGAYVDDADKPRLYERQDGKGRIFAVNLWAKTREQAIAKAHSLRNDHQMVEGYTPVKRAVPEETVWLEDDPVLFYTTIRRPQPRCHR